MNERWISEPRCGVCFTKKSEGCTCASKYSEGFMKMLSVLDVEKIIEQSHLVGANWESWEHHRKFLTDTIIKDSSVLDIGCANGFLLKSLQEWSEFEIDPYGIDSDKQLIEQSHVLFPGKQKHFAYAGIEDLAKIDKLGLPHRFDVILWNIWDDWIEQGVTPEIKHHIDTVLITTKNDGRLVIASYHDDISVSHDFSQELKEAGYMVSELRNTSGHVERAYIIEKST